MRRDDLRVNYNEKGTLGVLKQISNVCFMPLSFGGELLPEDIQGRLSAGLTSALSTLRPFKIPN